MKSWFATDIKTLIAIGISTLVIYLVVIAFTRIFGKRSFSKMSGFDFAMTIAVGSIIASTLLSQSVSLLEGVFGCFFIFLFQFLIAQLRRYQSVQTSIDNTPLLLMDKQEILDNNLKKARVTKSDLRAKLREANVCRLSQVRAVVFETTGDISVLHTNQKDLELEDWLLKDVKNQ